MAINSFNITKSKIRNIISDWENETHSLMELNIPDQNKSSIPYEAAVLIPMFYYKDEWNLLFTRRNLGLNEHSGQVSFPGGRTEPGDKNKRATALRETYEEIGIASEEVDILGNLPDILTITNFNVSPVVGVIPWPYPLIIAENEVSRVFSIPLLWLADSTNYSIKEKFYPGKSKPLSVIYYSEYDGELLWGVTARIVANFVEILLYGYKNKK